MGECCGSTESQQTGTGWHISEIHRSISTRLPVTRYHATVPRAITSKGFCKLLSDNRLIMVMVVPNVFFWPGNT